MSDDTLSKIGNIWQNGTFGGNVNLQAMRGIVVEELIVLGLVVISIFLSLVAKRFRVNKWFGETSMTVAVGFIAGLIVMASSGEGLKSAISLDSNVFWTLVLPPIIFEAGYGMSRSLFFKNFSPIVFLSFLGTGCATVVTGAVVWGLTSVTGTPFTFFESMTFGVIMSAIDPVSVLRIFMDTPINPNVHMIIFGEASINNAVSIILYRFVNSFADPSKSFEAGDFFVTVLAVIGVFLASVLFGVLIALILALILKHVNVGANGMVLEMTCVLIFAYSSYLLAEIAHLSGIVSILFCGATMAKYLYPNLSYESQKNTKNMLRVISFIAETALFIYLGLGLPAFKSEQRVFNVPFIFITLFAIIVARIHVFVWLPLTNLWKGESRLTWRQILYIFYAGLRGGVAFILSLDLNADARYRPVFRGMVLGCVMMIVVLSVVLFGGLAPKVIKWLSLDQEPEGQYLPTIDDEEEGILGNKPKRSKLQIRRKDLFDFDAKYIRPFFTKPPSPTDAEGKGGLDGGMNHTLRTGALDSMERNSPAKKKGQELFNAPDDM